MANDPTQPWPPSVIVRPPTRMFDDEDLGALVFGIAARHASSHKVVRLHHPN